MRELQGKILRGKYFVLSGIILLLIAALLYIKLIINLSSSDYTRKPLRILFIGNSLTMFNGGVNRELERLFDATNPKLLIVSQSVTIGGERLSGHYKNHELHQLIKNGKWDYVVLQEYSNNPITNKEDFYKYAGLFNTEIKKSGSKTLFFITWAYKNNLEMTKLLEFSYVSVARELHAYSIPVGRAWDRVLYEKSSINMYHDFKHPSKYGTYLAACCFYTYLTGFDPEQIDPPKYLKPADAKYIQKVSKEVIDEWKQGQRKK